MSFSGEVKEELLKQYASSEHCVYAELAAIIMFGGRRRTKSDNMDFLPEKGEIKVFLSTDNDFVRQKAFTLCKKNITIKVDAEKGILMFPAEFMKKYITPDPEGSLKRQCCKRAFLRGTYLCIGSMSNPGKSYHLEFDCITKEQACLLQELIAEFDIPAKIALRKKYYVVYVKEGSAICEMLNIMGAHVSLMDFENHRIVKEVRNSVNRKVNCETANIRKTVNAAAGQVKDIMLIEKVYGFGKLPENLREIAELRLEHQEATLQELGEMLTPPVGKSGVNHRLRKLSMIAESIRTD
ncbi:MAG: DNA-binding protein WhiA [Lachnospiraceae bacterium]|nr:DNA-binding protein WhiA [Lachnospiraceae bacterium]